MKRVLILGAGIATAVVVGIAGAAGAPSSGLDRKGVAQEILKVHGKYLSAPAQTALRMVANGDRQLVAPPQAFHGGPRSGGLAAGPSAAFTNVRVNDPALDSHQVDQTTQSETTIGVAGSNVAVGFNDSQQTLLALTAGSNLSGYAYSTDGGASFTDGGSLPNAPAFNNFGDPWLERPQRQLLLLDPALDGTTATWTSGSPSRPTAARRGPPVPVVSAADRHLLLRRQGRARGRPRPEQASDATTSTWPGTTSSFDLDTGAFYTGLPVARSTDGGATWQVTYADKVRASHPTGCSFTQYIGATPR